MGAATKGRRRISVDGEQFLWSLHEEDVNTVHVVSRDKRLILRFGWQHANPPGESFVDVMGSRFVGLPTGTHGWVRVQAPDWRDHPSSIEPRIVRTLIQWALSPKEQVVYKILPPGFSTHLITAAPWNGGIPTFSATPGQEKTYRDKRGGPPNPSLQRTLQPAARRRPGRYGGFRWPRTRPNPLTPASRTTSPRGQTSSSVLTVRN